MNPNNETDLLPCPETLEEFLDKWHLGNSRYTTVSRQDNKRLIEHIKQWQSRPQPTTPPDEKVIGEIAEKYAKKWCGDTPEYQKPVIQLITSAITEALSSIQSEDKNRAPSSLD